MAFDIKYFIGIWNMFGIPSSYKILHKINAFFQSDKKNNRKYKIIIAPPFTLLQDFSKKFKNKKIFISAQNSYHKDPYGAYTGNISFFMIKKLGVKHIIIGHSENRASGETDKIIKDKVSISAKNNFTIILCIGEYQKEKRENISLKVLKKQISNVIINRSNFKKIIIAYEPVWSIGTGKLPSHKDLKIIVSSLKKFIKEKFRSNYNIKVIYGGSVDKNSIRDFKSIKELDGFLIGSASKSSKNFIDIIKNFYK